MASIRDALVAAAACSTLAFADIGPARAQTMDRHVYTYLLLDRMEAVAQDGATPLSYEAAGWIGGDWQRVWLKAEGSHIASGAGSGAGAFETQALYSRLIAPFWEARGGVRYDRAYGGGDARSRAFLALGLEGLAPYWFEVEPALFVSQDGDVSARLEASYDLLFTQRLILQPDIEVNAALQEVPEFGVGSGLNDVELGFRLRYELRREIAPYAGWTWHRRLGGTADLARAAGEHASESAFVAGIRLWY